MSDDSLIPTYDRLDVSFERGEGIYLHDSSGKRYLDCLAGIAVNILGYRHPRMLEIAHDAVDGIHHLSNLFEIPSQTKLASKLSKYAGGTDAFFCNSGAEAIEASLKFCRKYSARFGHGGRTILSAKNSFHGRTLGALAATGQEKYKEGFEPLPEKFVHSEFNDIEKLESVINEEICGVLVEPIQGEGGVVPADGDYLKEIRRLCDDYGALMIVDEIQAGMGRTGEFLSIQNYDVKPDVITLAKGLAGGFPMGALLVDDELDPGLQPGDHASTFGGNPFVSSVAVGVLKILKKEELMINARDRGEQFRTGLKAISSSYANVGAPRGQGLMLGLPLGEPLDAGEIMSVALEEGLVIGTAGDNVLRLVPPLIITDSEVGEVLNRLDDSINQAVDS